MTQDPSHEIFVGQTALYALGGLEGSERRRFEQHLEICRTCVDEVSSFIPVTQALVFTVPAQIPPARLRERIVGAAPSVSPESEALSASPESEALSASPESEALSASPESEALSASPESEALSAHSQQVRRVRHSQQVRRVRHSQQVRRVRHSQQVRRVRHLRPRPQEAHLPSLHRSPRRGRSFHRLIRWAIRQLRNPLPRPPLRQSNCPANHSG